MIRRTLAVPIVAAVLTAPAPAAAQTTTYHLHNEVSSTPIALQLKTTGPDVATVAIQSGDLKGHGAEDASFRTFMTEPGVPNLAGVVPSGSVIAFRFFMRKTSNYGTVFPRAQLSLNWTPTATFCTVNGSTVLTTTLQPFTFTCTTTAPVSTHTTWGGIPIWHGDRHADGSRARPRDAHLRVYGRQLQ